LHRGLIREEPVSSSGIRRVAAEHGHSVHRWLNGADARYQAVAQKTQVAAIAAVRAVHAGALSARLRASWPAITDTVLAFTILGGVMAVPVACAFALITGLLHASASLRTATPQIFGIAVLWFLGAIIAAHFQPRRAS
jgi:hypothetical protein